MKRFFYLAVVALAFSCAQNNSYTISGVVDGIVEGDTVELFSYANAKPESPLSWGVVAESGEFELTGVAESTNIGVLMVNGTKTIGALVVEPGKINVARQDDGMITIAGTPLNDVYVDFVAQITAIRASFYQLDRSLDPNELIKLQDAIYDEHTQLVAATVNANIGNALGAFIFATSEYDELESTEAMMRMSQFSDQIKNLEFMQEVSTALKAKLQTEVGQKYTDIKLNNQNGVEIAVSDLLAEGKYVLIDFWATWCVPCMSEMPHLKEAYAEFKNKGFEIYGVSLDRSEADWRGVIGDDMPWVHVINVEGATATVDYAIRTIPSNFLISPDGVIVAKDLRGESVKDILGEHIK